MRKTILLSAVALGAITLGANAAAAQQTGVTAAAEPDAAVAATSAEPAVSAPPAADAGTSLDIVVTAQRREERLQKVPLSVTAVSADTLASRHFTDPAQLQFVSPNLQFTSFSAAPGATNFSVRGIGTSSFSHLIEPSVATVIDGVVLARPEMGVMQFSDLARVEVLAGPQGMLFGKNASAGLINIVTNKPVLGKFEVIAHGEAGIVNAFDTCCTGLAQVTVNAPVTATSALRINGYYNRYPGLVGDVTPNPGSNYGHEEYGAKLKYLWELNDRLTINLGADYAHGNGIGTGATTARSVAADSPLLPQEIAAGIVAGPHNTKRSSNAHNNVIFDVGGVSSDVTYTFDNDVSISNILAYRKYKAHHTFDGDYHQYSFFDIAAARFNFDQVTEELRIASPAAARLQYQLGMFLYFGQNNRYDFVSGNFNLGAIPAGYINYGGFNAYDKLKSRSYAVYGQATYKLTDRARLTAGGRYTWDRLTDDGQVNNDGFVFGFSPAADRVAHTRAKDFSWRVSGQYDLTPAVMGYVTVSTGYKGPGFNQIYGGALAIGPEHSDAYEVGVKSQIGGRLLLNVAAYWEKVRDLQVQTYVPAILAYIVSNAGSLRSRGVEAEARFKATRDLSLSVNGSYNDARFTSFKTAPCYPGQTLSQGCVSDPANPANTFTDATGNRLQNAPRWSGTAAVDYNPIISSSRQLFVHADVYGRTRVNFQANGNPAAVQKGYALVNGSLGYGPEDGRWRAGIFCRNCFDRRFVTFIEANPGGVAGDYSQTFGLTSFRTLGLSFDVRF